MISLAVRLWLFDTSLVQFIFFCNLFVFLLSCWIAGGQIKIVIEWFFTELCTSHPNKSFTVIRDGKMVKNLRHDQVVCGDILVLSRKNPYAPEECIVLNQSDIETSLENRLQSRFLARHDKLHDFADSKYVHALVCSTARTRLERKIVPSKTLSELRKFEKKLDKRYRRMFGTNEAKHAIVSDSILGIDNLSFALNALGAVLVINVILAIVV